MAALEQRLAASEAEVAASRSRVAELEATQAGLQVRSTRHFGFRVSCPKLPSRDLVAGRLGSELWGRNLQS